MCDPHRIYKPGRFLACPLCYTEESSPMVVQQILDIDKTLFCFQCGKVPQIWEWPDSWPRRWVQFGALPFDEGWQDDSKYQKGPNAFNKVVMPVYASKMVGDALDVYKKHFPDFFDALKS